MIGLLGLLLLMLILREIAQMWNHISIVAGQRPPDRGPRISPGPDGLLKHGGFQRVNLRSTHCFRHFPDRGWTDRLAPIRNGR